MEETVTCPYCGEPTDITVDEEGSARQEYIEDCWVCCRPITVVILGDEKGDRRLTIHRGDG